MSEVQSAARLADSEPATTRVLACLTTFNAADVIETTLQALFNQTRPPDAILIIDNASSDDTLNRTFPDRVIVIRNAENVGPSGSIPIGFRYALEHGYDWMWILDHDSAPAPAALVKLLGLYSGWPRRLQEETAFISCLPTNPGEPPLHGRLFTPGGRFLISPPPDQRYYLCHVKVWSGCLYRMAAVREIGFPNPDYFIDRGELEYAYRVMKAGYKGYIDQESVLNHNFHGTPGLSTTRAKIGPLALTFYELAPLRCYYVCRNTLYFTLYDATDGPMAKFRELFRLLPRPGRSVLSGIAWQTALLTLNFALRPRTHWAQVRACLRGTWDGVTGNMAARF